MSEKRLSSRINVHRMLWYSIRSCCIFQRHFRQTGQRQIRLHVRPGWQIRNRSTSLVGEHRLEAVLLDVFRGKLSKHLLTLSARYTPSAPLNLCLCGVVTFTIARKYSAVHLAYSDARRRFRDRRESRSRSINVDDNFSTPGIITKSHCRFLMTAVFCRFSLNSLQN